jgi:hypothetical protein
MQREDYILRMIAQMGRILTRIRHLLVEGKNAEAGEDLASVAQKGGLDLELVIALDEASLGQLLLTGGEIDRPKCALFAEVIYLEWRRQVALGNAVRARRCAERSLLLNDLAYDGVVIGREAQEQVAELRQGIGAGPGTAGPGGSNDADE